MRDGHAGLRKLAPSARFLLSLRVLPRGVALFQWRARRLAARLGDEFGPVSATRPGKLATLLELAADRRYVVELGTAMGWTAIALALADPMREVATYDPSERPEVDLYLELVPDEVRRRVSVIVGPSDQGPRVERSVDLLYIDSSHEREGTLRELEAWSPALSNTAVVVFDDYSHPDYPGVKQAIEELGLDGEEREGLFVHHVRNGSRRQSAPWQTSHPPRS
jgi:predicted O-methyltransferase YrrM